jgi:hypothetical protein
MWFWLMPDGTLPTALSIETRVTTSTVGNTIIHSIHGTVRDRSGNALSDAATVILTGPSNRTEETEPQGQFAFANVAPGSYVVTAKFGDLATEMSVTVPGTSVPIPPIFDPGDFPGRRLNEVRGLGSVFMARLETSGITHPAEVAALEPTVLAEILRISERQASTIIATAQRLLAG